MQIKVFTAFSGYDSQCMALDRLKQLHPEFDYELVGWSEIDKHAITAHNAVYPQWADRNYGDISKVDWSNVPDFDLFTMSSPCQDFSMAGLRRGGAEGSGTRSSLLWECRKAIAAKRPKYVLMENVKGLITKTFIQGFQKWLSELEGFGYENHWQVVNACEFANVPQNRERVFVVSVLRELGQEFCFPKNIERTTQLEDLLEPSVDESFYLPQDKVDELISKCEKTQLEEYGIKM